MQKIEDGGSAFPEIFTDQKFDGRDRIADTYSAGGMTLRDYFAAKAMPLYFGNLAKRADRVHPKEYAEAAGNCFRDADAMIQARKGGAA